jgi:chaperone required for assembly of F1-ATPase
VTKRFYKEAAATEAAGDGHGVALDGRPIRTPGGAPLIAPSAVLAEAIAAEWSAQENEIRPRSMPMMCLAATAIDRIGRERATIVDQIAAYGGSDLLCYRADSPAPLVERQAQQWQPLLDWVAEAHGARLAVTHDITHVAQDRAALDALRAAVEALDDCRLAAVSQLTAICGSLVIALAVEAGHIGAGEATAVSLLDEKWQIENWGEDEEATERHENLAREIADAVRFLALLEG